MLMICTIPRCNARCLSWNLLPHMAQSSKTNTTKNCQGRLDWRHFQKRISTTYATCVPILVNNSSQHAALGQWPAAAQIFCLPYQSANNISDSRDEDDQNDDIKTSPLVKRTESSDLCLCHTVVISPVGTMQLVTRAILIKWWNYSEL